METVSIGVIGGSGLYRMPELQAVAEYEVETPFGRPSGPIVVGTLRGKRVAFVARHGIGHFYTPSTVPYRANIYALKQMGVRHILAVNACGSLREDYAPGHIVIPDQIYDRTESERGRSFFDAGLVSHVSVADPFCNDFNHILQQAVAEVGGTVHAGGTFVIIEGPRFSTRAESQIYRKLGCDLIGMTTCPEVFLAREAEICYSVMAHITDYDVWHVSESPVTVEKVLETFHKNIELAQQAVAKAVELLPPDHTCECHEALRNTFMTAPQQITAEMRKRLHPLISKYFPD